MCHTHVVRLSFSLMVSGVGLMKVWHEMAWQSSLAAVHTGEVPFLCHMEDLVHPADDVSLTPLLTCTTCAGPSW